MDHHKGGAVFRYLVSKTERDPQDVVECSYSRKELQELTLVRDEYNGCYRTFRSPGSFWKYSRAVPAEQRCFHEVILGWRPQRLKFDIDAPANKLDAITWGALRGLGIAPVVVADPGVSDLLDELLGEDPSPPSLAAPVLQPSTEEERARKMEAIIDCLIETLLDELHGAYYAIDDITATRQDIILADSSGYDPKTQGTKYSYHLIYATSAVANNEEAKDFTARFLQRLPVKIRSLVDPGVNKSVQNFRAAESTKPGAGRPKKVCTRFQTADVLPEETMIVAPNEMRVLTQLCTDAQGGLDLSRRAARSDLEDEDVEAVLAALTEPIVDGHKYRGSRENLLMFDRVKPTHCFLCGETHHRDNTLMLKVQPEPGPWPDLKAKVPHQIIELCRHNPKVSRHVGAASLALRDPDLLSENFGGLSEEKRAADPPAGSNAKRGKPGVVADAAATTPLENSVAGRIEMIRTGQLDPHKTTVTLFESVPAGRKTVYSEGKMRGYEDVPTLAVRAQMKLGKTRALREYLNRVFGGAGALRAPVIRFVTFRQTFSNSLKESFPEFTLYSEVTGGLDHIRHPALIVQVESLHRLVMPSDPEPIDLLVLDEVESILAQFNSGLHRHFNASWAMFQWMLGSAARVVCMDANLSDRTYRTLERMRSGHPVHFHWNQYPRAGEDRYYVTVNQPTWIGALHQKLREGAKIVLPTNSLAEAKTFREVLESEFPNKKIRLYSSETPPSVKARHFADVHTHWTGLDVLIYTPTVSAGVSFEAKHFDVLFGYFCDMSCDVETCRQMLGRVRNIATKEHYLCLVGTGNNLPTDIGTIRSLVHDRRSNLFRQIRDAGAGTTLALHFEYGPRGEVRHYETPYFHLWLENFRIENLSRNRFISRFIDQIADTGASLAVLRPPDGASGELIQLRLQHKEAKKEVKTAAFRAIAEAPNITPEEAVGVRNDLTQQRDVASLMLAAYEKYMLFDTYQWHGRPADEIWIQNYHPLGVRRIYKNLLRITEKETLLASLSAIQAVESEHYRYVMEAQDSARENRDLHHKYVFVQHLHAIWLLRICGFRCITDTARIRVERAMVQLRASKTQLIEKLDAVGLEFGIQRPRTRSIACEDDDDRYLTIILGLVNRVLRAMYGIEVRRATKREGRKNLHLNKTQTGRLFIFSLEPDPEDKRPHIPSKLVAVGDPRTDRVGYFLEQVYYDDVLTAADELEEAQQQQDIVPRRPRAIPGQAEDSGMADFLAAEYYGGRSSCDERVPQRQRQEDDAKAVAAFLDLTWAAIQ